MIHLHLHRYTQVATRGITAVGAGGDYSGRRYELLYESTSRLFGATFLMLRTVHLHLTRVLNVSRTAGEIEPEGIAQAAGKSKQQTQQVVKTGHEMQVRQETADIGDNRQRQTTYEYRDALNPAGDVDGQEIYTGQEM